MNVQVLVFCCVIVGSKATRGMPESVATDPMGLGSNRGMATQFSPDVMFSGPLFGCSGSPKQAQKPGNRLRSLESGLEASQAAFEASQTASEAFQTGIEASQTAFEAS